MKTPRIPFAILLALVSLSANACSDAAAPAARHSAESLTALRDVQVNGPQDIPLDDGESLPPEYYAAPLIESTTLDSDFAKDFAFATASMRYFATHAKIDLGLKIKRGTEVVDSGSSLAVDENLLPFFHTVVARFTLSNPGPCGHRMDAKGVYSAWMAFPMPKVATLFSWGLTTQSLSKPSAQRACFTGGDSSGDGEYWDFLFDDPERWDPEGSDDAYGGSCGLYQLWIMTVNGVIVDMWWERTDIDEEFCDSINVYY